MLGLQINFHFYFNPNINSPSYTPAPLVNINDGNTIPNPDHDHLGNQCAPQPVSPTPSNLSSYASSATLTFPTSAGPSIPNPPIPFIDTTLNPPTETSDSVTASPNLQLIPNSIPPALPSRNQTTSSTSDSRRRRKSFSWKTTQVYRWRQGSQRTCETSATRRIKNNIKNMGRNIAQAARSVRFDRKVGELYLVRQS